DGDQAEQVNRRVRRDVRGEDLLAVELEPDDARALGRQIDLVVARGQVDRGDRTDRVGPDQSVEQADPGDLVDDLTGDGLVGHLTDRGGRRGACVAQRAQVGPGDVVLGVPAGAGEAGQR